MISWNCYCSVSCSPTPKPRRQADAGAVGAHSHSSQPWSCFGSCRSWSALACPMAGCYTSFRSASNRQVSAIVRDAATAQSSPNNPITTHSTLQRSYLHHGCSIRGSPSLWNHARRTSDPRKSLNPTHAPYSTRRLTFIPSSSASPVPVSPNSDTCRTAESAHDTRSINGTGRVRNNPIHHRQERTGLEENRKSWTQLASRAIL